VSLVFSFAIFFLGVAAAIGGIVLPSLGPRKLALTGSVLFSLGSVIAGLALSAHSLALLYIGYGIIGGTGLGLGYVTPVATVSQWFPTKKGLGTGIVIMGFGFGALFMSKVLAPLSMTIFANNLVHFFFVFCAYFCGSYHPFIFNFAKSRRGESPVHSNIAPFASFKQSSHDIFSKRFLPFG